MNLLGMWTKKNQKCTFANSSISHINLFVTFKQPKSKTVAMELKPTNQLLF